VEFAVKDFNRILQKQAQEINTELELRRKELHFVSTQVEQQHPDIHHAHAHEILSAINEKIKEPIVIIRIFKALQAFLNESFKEEAKEKNPKKKDSQSTRIQIINDKKKHLLQSLQIPR
jgi:hypothetical protein